VQMAKRSRPYAPTPGGYAGPVQSTSSKYIRSRRSPPYSSRRGRSTSHSRERR
jgi:hypothetical protein